jgi:hypothetical protein
LGGRDHRFKVGGIQEVSRATSFEFGANPPETDPQLSLPWNTKGFRLETYQLIAMTGKPIRKATRVIFPDGRPRFSENP